MGIKNNRNGSYLITPNGMYMSIDNVMSRLYSKNVLHHGGICGVYRVMIHNGNISLVDENHLEWDVKNHKRNLKEAEYISEWLSTDHAMFEAYTKSF